MFTLSRENVNFLYYPYQMKKRRIQPLLICLSIPVFGIAVLPWYVHVHLERARLQSLLIVAVKAGDGSKVRTLLDRGADPNARDREVSRPSGLFAQLRSILSPPRNVLADKGKTALMIAISKEDVQSVQCLLAHGVDVNAKDASGLTAISWVVPSPATFPLTMSDTQRERFLAKHPIYPLLKLLTDHGADVNVKSHDEDPMLMEVVEGTDSVDCTLLLLQHGADVNAQGRDKETALFQAVRTGRMELVCPLVQAGANVNAQNDNDATCLMIAAADGEEEIVTFLLNHGADINAQTKAGATPLICTTPFPRNLSVIKLLLKRGACVNLSKEGFTPLDEAIRFSNKNAIALLKKYGAKE